MSSIPIALIDAHDMNHWIFWSRLEYFTDRRHIAGILLRLALKNKQTNPIAWIDAYDVDHWIIYRQPSYSWKCAECGAKQQTTIETNDDVIMTKIIGDYRQTVKVTLF